MNNKNRFFIPVAPFAIADFIRSLENTGGVSNIFITMQDSELTVAYTYDPYKKQTKMINLRSQGETLTQPPSYPSQLWEREKAIEYE